MVGRFANERHLTVPAFVDPSGELAAKVKADFALGEKVGIDHTPTVHVVSNSQQSPYIEVKGRRAFRRNDSNSAHHQGTGSEHRWV